MTQQLKKDHPTVYLVGAGPGDPGLITARGLAILRQADAVVFDALANPLLLDEAPPHAIQIDVGKRAGRHKMTQDEINSTLVELARSHTTIVRLKGGDPYLFGRGAEEAAFCAQHGVACEVIPGITAGIAAPAMAGIPVTHRTTASMVTFVTGHEDPTKDETSVDYPGLASLIKKGGTVCFYMGVGRLAAICEALQQQGVPASMPIALVQWGTLPCQRSIRSTLVSVVQDVQNAGISSPAIIVVGKAAEIEEPGLDFFTSRPLFGTRIVVTRTRQQASALSQLLMELGADVIESPTIEIVPHSDDAAIHQAVRDVQQYDWLVLTSANAVQVLAAALDAQQLDSRQLAGVKIAAIGSAVEAALREKLAIRPDLVPTRYVAESLAAQLIADHDVRNKSFLLLRADIARPALPRLLTEAGANITELVAYETKIADHLDERVLTALREKTIDWVTFTSSSTARNMVELLGSERDLLQHAKIASIGTITTQTLRDLNLPVTTEARQSTIEGLVAAIVQHVSDDSPRAATVREQAMRHGDASPNPLPDGRGS